MRAAKSVCNHLEMIVQEQEIDADVRVKNLNILKMLMYLFTQIMKTKDSKLAADVSFNKVSHRISSSYINEKGHIGIYSSHKY